jgi:hypothetical protein
MQSSDLEHWSEPRLLRVKGPDIRIADMGRMIDPYLVPDKDKAGRWWCFYKQNGVSMSYTGDFENWTYFGRADCGENVCVLTRKDHYLLFHSPSNGIGLKRTPDLKQWKDVTTWTLGQDRWPWASARITAGHVLDLRNVQGVGRYVMFFHGSSKKGMQQHRAHGHGTLAMAWSRDLQKWHWPE